MEKLKDIEMSLRVNEIALNALERVRKSYLLDRINLRMRRKVVRKVTSLNKK